MKDYRVGDIVDSGEFFNILERSGKLSVSIPKMRYNANWDDVVRETGIVLGGAYVGYEKWERLDGFIDGMRVAYWKRVE